jgi:transcriptional regulator with XRE-family HTH domain
MATASRQQVAMYGHIAARLRAFLKERDWMPPDLSEALGQGRGSATVYKWLAATGAPAPRLRAKLAKATGIAETDLMPRKPGVPAPAQAVALVTSPARIGPTRAVEALSFVVTATGEARIKLDLTLPLATATPLLRMLLDAGIVFGDGPAG